MFLVMPSFLYEIFLLFLTLLNSFAFNSTYFMPHKKKTPSIIKILILFFIIILPKESFKVIINIPSNDGWNKITKTKSRIVWMTLEITARAFFVFSFCNSLLLPLEYDRRRNRDAIQIEISIINDPIEE